MKEAAADRGEGRRQERNERRLKTCRSVLRPLCRAPARRTHRSISAERTAGSPSGRATAWSGQRWVWQVSRARSNRALMATVAVRGGGECTTPAEQTVQTGPAVLGGPAGAGCGRTVCQLGVLPGTARGVPKADADSWWSRADSPHLGGDRNVPSVCTAHTQSGQPS